VRDISWIYKLLKNCILEIGQLAIAITDQRKRKKDTHARCAPCLPAGLAIYNLQKTSVLVLLLQCNNVCC